MAGRVIVATVTNRVTDGQDASAIAVLTLQGRRLVQPRLSVVHTFGYPREPCAPAMARGMREAIDVSVIADVDEPYDRPWLAVADAVLGRAERLSCPPRQWIAQVFARFPGAAVAAVGCGTEGSALGLRDGALVVIGAASGLGDAVLPAFLHGWLASGHPVTALDGAVLGAGRLAGHRRRAATVGRLRLRHVLRVRLDRWQPVE